MMIFQPDINLDRSLEISYPQEVLDWVKENTPGLKYIAIKKYNKRDDYTQIMRINLQDNPSPSQKPEESPTTICETIYKVLQYHRDGEDAPCRYKLTIYKKTNAGVEKPVTKHVNIGSDLNGDIESTMFDPGRAENITLVDKLMEHIDRLQDSVTGLNNMTAQIIQPVISMNKELMLTNTQLSSNMVRMKEIEVIQEREREAEKIRLLIEQQKIAANKEKFNTAMKTMNKNGALDKLMAQIAGKFLGDNSNQAEIKPPSSPKKPRQIPSPQEVKSPPRIEEEEMKREIEKQIQEQMRVAPLYTLCNGLKVSLNQDEEENPDSSIKEYIKDTINEELYNDLNELLNSENEEDAKTNLVNLRDTLNDNTEEYPKLLMIKSRLTEAQQNIITKILNYEG